MPLSSKKTSENSFHLQNAYAKEAQRLIAHYPKHRKQSAVIGLLDLCQRQNKHGHYITDAAIDYVAETLEMPRIRVFEVASFYSMLNLKPVGKYHLQLCGTTPCMLRGANELCDAIEKKLNLRKGETTQDGIFTLSEVECLGACVNAPMVQINDDYYEDLSIDSMLTLLDDLKKGNRPTPGPQTGRKSSEPFKEMKKTS